MAAGKGYLNICQLLIKNGVKKDPRTNDGYTPLDLAAKHKHLKVVAYLRYLRGKKNELTHGKKLSLYHTPKFVPISNWNQKITFK